MKKVKDILRLYALPITVFLTGACVLVVEVVATRILSPYFGNTIYTFSSVISVILAALSIGYYVGGKLADKRPSALLFYGIILVSGLLLLVLQIISAALLPSLGENLSLTSGPLITSMLFFFVPAVLLGTLSPFAVKLQKVYAPKQGVGSIAGTIFFWSTLGSIAGSLSAGFVLIPHFGVTRIIAGCGVVLCSIGLIPLVALGITKRLTRAAIILMILGSFVAFTTPTTYGKVLYSKDGVYEKITIFDTEHNGRPTRYLLQDRNNSAAMYLDSDELVHEYTKYFSLYQLFTPDIAQALVIGGGAYSVPKALLQADDNVQVDVSEIEPDLYRLSQQYFKLTPDSRLHNFTQDGRRMLGEQNKKYDLIFSDVYQSLYSVPAHFTTQQFYELAKSRLSEGGIFVGNLIGDLSRQEPSFIMSEMKTMQRAFTNSYVFAVKSPAHRGAQNLMFVGVNGTFRPDVTAANVKGHANPIIRMLAEKQVDTNRFEFSNVPVLTDDYAPVEYLIGKVLSRGYGDNKQPVIDGNEMMALIGQQLRYGPRHPGSKGHEQLTNFLQAELRSLTPDVRTQTWMREQKDHSPQSYTNVIGRLAPEKTRRIILAAHYDTKAHADRDPKKPQEAVPGANDAGSGVAVLLEVARHLATSEALNVGVDVVFFDGEEGEPHTRTNDSTPEPIGSTYFAAHLEELYPQANPESGIVFDMVCDKDLQLRKEPNSQQHAGAAVDAFWKIAKDNKRLGFSDSKWQGIIDDHTALNKAGIPSFLVIDFNYKAFHTTRDTLGQCSPQSLESVALTTVDYLRSL